MKRTEAIQAFLQSASSPLAKLYEPCMEVQVNVEKGKGIPYVSPDKMWRGFSNEDGTDIWKNIRIPRNANGVASMNDGRMMFDLFAHAEGVGMTGWDFVNKKSRWVGFDFDSIVNHKAGISQSELKKVQEEVEKIGWAEVYTSTSGKGFHIYIFFEGDGFPTETHTEHSALARSVLSLMSAEAGYNFVNSVDCVGSILWVWHKKQAGTGGLQCLKPKTSTLQLCKVPKNWKEHMSVVSGKGKRVHLNKEQSELSQAIQDLRLEPEHQMVLKWLSANAKYTWWWDSDHTMLVCHTLDLKEAHTSLNLKGLFETESSGTSDKNCFAFPQRGGKWNLRRFGVGVAEHPVWEKDKKGWTRIVYNENPNFNTCCRFFGGAKDSKGRYVVKTNEQVLSILGKLGVEAEPYPPTFDGRKTCLEYKSKEGLLLVSTDKTQFDHNIYTTQGWVEEGKMWLRVFDYSEDMESTLEIDVDKHIRHCISEDDEAGWYINIENKWVGHPRKDVESVLEYLLPDLKGNERNQMIGKTLLTPYKMVAIPFEEEYMVGRFWNKNGAQLGVVAKKGNHPTWNSLLEHNGTHLTEYVLENQWCKDNGVLSGADYLLFWISSMFQNPELPLPYLFFYGEQNTGKSTFHEALSLLFKNKRGYIKADNCLKNVSGFNDELEGTILAVVEETNLKESKVAYNRIKEWVTARTIAINQKYESIRQTTNYTHWVHCANSVDYVPVFDGDTRILVIEVPRLDVDIPKEKLMDSLFEEAPAFLNTLMNLVFPENRCGRLSLPVLETAAKREVMDLNKTVLELFVDENVYPVLGERITLEEFTKTFIKMIEMTQGSVEASKWNRVRIGKEFPRKAPFLVGYDNYKEARYIFNASFSKIGDGVAWTLSSKGTVIKGKEEKTQVLSKVRKSLLQRIKEKNNG